MATDLTIPDAAVRLTLEDGRPNPEWYRVLSRLVGLFNDATGSIDSIEGSTGFLADGEWGDIAFRGEDEWEVLAAGTDGQFLQTQGPDADPQWADAESQIVTPIAAGAIAGSTTNVDIPLGSHDMVEIEIFAIEPSNDGVQLNMLFSQDGGANYLTGASDYAWGIESNATVVQDAADSRLLVINLGIGNAAGETGLAKIRLYRPSASSFFKQAVFEWGSTSTAGLYFVGQGWGRLAANTDPITHARLTLSAGTFDAGYYAARGYSFT